MQPPEAHGVYLHVPWCRLRCPYCAFVVVPDRPGVPRQELQYLEAVRRELAARATHVHGDRQTVYLGGGTPSRLTDEVLTSLLQLLIEPATIEVTLECNPEDVTRERLTRWVAAGVTRISLGVQTLHRGHARRLGRAHTPHHARTAMALLQEAQKEGRLQSWSADLMFGLHEQTVAELEGDLDAYLAYEPPHLSIYGLTIEAGTPFDLAMTRGVLTLPTEDTWRQLHDLMEARLLRAGLERYEVSNFSKPGHRSLHNQGYWQDRPYVGLGPGAHGYLADGTRYENVADLEGYLQQEDPTATQEQPSPHARAVERLLSGLRGVEGVSLIKMLQQTGHTVRPEVLEALEVHGLIQQSDGFVSLTRHGMPLADGITASLVDALCELAPE